MSKKTAFSILYIVLLVSGLLTLVNRLAKEVRADISSCTVNSVNPSLLTGGGSSTAVFNITNTDEAGNLLHMVRITSPSSNFVITGADGPSLGGVNINGDGSSVDIMTTLSVGESGDFTLNLTTVGGVTTTESFSISASDLTDGSSIVSCGSASISLQSAGSSGISMSNLTVSVGSQTASLSWDTNITTTVALLYGSTADYGQILTDSTPSKHHTISISGLSSSSTYHYKIINTDLSNNSIQSQDSTFTTSSSGSTTTTTTTVTSVSTVIKYLLDTTKPAVVVQSELKKVYEEAPVISYQISDDKGIASLSYSIDGGSNWFNIVLDKIGSKKIISKFVPNVHEDGDYELVVKAIDTSGNEGLSKKQKFTIDRLPPKTGALLLSLGAINITPDSSGYLKLFSGLEYKFITTASGGPNKITLTCSDYSFDFTKSETNSFWSATYKFDKPVECSAKLVSVDGAGNIENKDSLKINVIEKYLTNAKKITIYVYDNILNKFVVWNGDSYGQNNPIYPSGYFSAILVPGKYYIEASISNFVKSFSKLITITETSMIDSDFVVGDKFNIKSYLGLSQVNLDVKSLSSSQWFESDEKLNIKGKDQIVVFTTTWSKDALSYLKVLDKAKKENIKYEVVFVHESKSLVSYFLKRSGLDINYRVDTDGNLLGGLNLNTYPTTYIIDKNGRVLTKRFGVVDFEELKNKYMEKLYY